MRVTGNSVSFSIVTRLNLLAARQARLQNQVSSGMRIQAPEDDPAAMGTALRLQDLSSTTAQFAKSISTLQGRAGAVYEAFKSLKSISDRATEIANRVSGATPPQELQAFAVELKQLIQQAVQLANSKDGNQYLFAGTDSSQPPFVATTDADGNVTAVTYQGNTGTASTEIAENTTVSIGAPGANGAGAGPRGVFSDSRFGADFFNHLITLQNHLVSGDYNAITTTDRQALLKDEDNLIFQATQNTVMQARLDVAAAGNESRRAGLDESLTRVAGADLAETLVQLSRVQNAYEVAAQSSAKFLQLQQTFLNYIS